MPLSADDLTEIQNLLASAEDGPDVIGQLRRRFPSLSVTRCDANDVVEMPFAVSGHFDLHLVDTLDHCAKLTSDPSQASGLVLAQRKAET